MSVAMGCLVTLAASTARSACTRDAAAGLYADARRAFDDRRYDDSVELLQRAYACDPSPAYLYNIARAYEEANRPKDALAAWRAYLEVAKDERERVQVQGRMSTLSKMIEELDRLEREKNAAEQARQKAEAEASRRQAPPPVPPPPPAPPPPEPKHVEAGAWILTGVGASSLIVAAVLGFESMAKHQAAVNEPQVVQAESLQGDARTFAQGANWTWAVGGAVTAVGLGWIGIDLLAAPAPASKARVGLAVEGRGAVIALSGSM